MRSFSYKWPYRLQQTYRAARFFPLNFVALAIEKRLCRYVHKGIAHDPRRFRRVQREAHVVVVRSLRDMSGGYKRLGRRIFLNFTHLQAAEEYGPNHAYYEWFVAWWACTIVHEATHGALYSRYIPYTRETYLRIERMCHDEEARFAARLPPTPLFDYAAQLVEPFDANWYIAFVGAAFERPSVFTWRKRDAPSFAATQTARDAARIAKQKTVRTAAERRIVKHLSKTSDFAPFCYAPIKKPNETIPQKDNFSRAAIAEPNLRPAYQVQDERAASDRKDQ